MKEPIKIYCLYSQFFEYLKDNGIEYKQDSTRFYIIIEKKDFKFINLTKKDDFYLAKLKNQDWWRCYWQEGYLLGKSDIINYWGESLEKII